MHDPPPLTPVRAKIADALEREAASIVREWLDCLRARIGTRTIFALPEQALENHIPPVLKSLSAFVRLPIEAMRTETIGHLRMHALIRKQQGYDVQELMLEFDYLSEIVVARMLEELRGGDQEMDPAAVAEVFNLLNSGLRAMGFVTVGVYWEKEEESHSELSKRLREFADMLSHEIRQPLQTAAIGVDMLRQEAVRADPSQVERYLGAIESSLGSTTELVESICLLAAAESAREDQTAAELGVLVERVLSQLRGMADERAVRLQVEGALPDVELKPLAVHLALLNLVSNAIKYRDPDKPESWVKLSATWTPKTEHLGACVICVEDNGIGIPPESRDHVFQRHFRAHPEMAEGLGLGLSIARHALQQGSGRLWLESEAGRGSRFFIEIEGRSLDVDGEAPGSASVDSLLKGVPGAGDGACAEG